MGGARVPSANQKSRGEAARGRLPQRVGARSRFPPYASASPGALLPEGLGPRWTQGGPPRAQEAEGCFSLLVFDVRPPPLSPYQETASRPPTPPLPSHGLQATVAPADTSAEPHLPAGDTLAPANPSA